MIKQQTGWALAGTFVFVVLVYLLKAVLAPFLLAALFAYLANPLVNRLVAYKIPRTVATVIVFVLLFGLLILLLVLIIPIVERQIVALIDEIPQIFTWGQGTLLPWRSHLQARYGLHLYAMNTTLPFGSSPQFMAQASICSGTIKEHSAHPRVPFKQIRPHATADDCLGSSNGVTGRNQLSLAVKTGTGTDFRDENRIGCAIREVATGFLHYRQNSVPPTQDPERLDHVPQPSRAAAGVCPVYATVLNVERTPSSVS